MSVAQWLAFSQVPFKARAFSIVYPNQLPVFEFVSKPIYKRIFQPIFQSSP